ncbi:DUF3068 domain-containing protein [Streptomyces sp. H27-D2]|uniref:DUF3068 domain-containing protein n=1 Tax=Streptomyces sp. H27-D2 TaxID=3046304 RepID=UPI002DBAD359|nr:DUF3068 domain-containing protein [Streptomyces sp. H27-D2]MEC4016155.1 DUF3068 domain-containing protein [Streptomyces sp. H27-D2]
MRRTASPLSLILLGTGVFLLVLAPLLAWYVEPRAKRTPIDVNVTTVFTGTGSYFDADAVETKKDQKLTITRRVLGDVADSERSGRAVWDVSTAIDTPRTLPLKDPRRSLQWTTERWVTDRRTNAPVHCCDESPTPFAGDAYLKFPFDVRKRTYRWWDNTLGATVPLRFDGSARVQGYGGYRFTGQVPATKTGTRQVPGVLVDRPKQGQVLAEEWYANPEIELVVDRRTGRIVNAKISPKKTLRAPGGKRDKVILLQGDGLEFTDKTQRQQVDLASSDSDRLRLVGETAPTAGTLAGALLAGAGVVLLVRGRRRSS